MYRISIYIEDVLDKIWEIKLGINWARAKEASWFKRGKKEKKKLNVFLEPFEGALVWLK